MSTFDYESFASTATDLSKVAENMDWKAIPDKYEAMGQISKIDYKSMEEYKDKFNGRDVVSMMITWELRDDNLRQQMNMEKLEVRQDILLELTAPPPPMGNGTIKWGQNQNQTLKDLIKAVKLDGEKKFMPPMLLHQMGWLVLKNVPADDDSGRSYTRVNFVKEAQAGQRSWEARQSPTAR